jgi:hypothetical protein
VVKVPEHGVPVAVAGIIRRRRCYLCFHVEVSNRGPPPLVAVGTLASPSGGQNDLAAYQAGG